MAKDKKVINFCNGKKCCKYNKDIKDCLANLVESTDKKIKLKKTKCLGQCKKAPVVCIKKDACLTKANQDDLKIWFQEKIG